MIMFRIPKTLRENLFIVARSEDLMIHEHLIRDKKIKFNHKVPIANKTNTG